MRVLCRVAGSPSSDLALPGMSAVGQTPSVERLTLLLSNTASSPSASTGPPDGVGHGALTPNPLARNAFGDWLLNFRACLNELLWEQLAQNQCKRFYR
jgi:hypothetical protein